MPVTFYADGAPENLKVNLCNRNAHLVLDELGYLARGYFSAPVEEFLAACRAWLARSTASAAPTAG